MAEENLSIESLQCIVDYYEKLIVSYPDAINIQDTVDAWKNRLHVATKKQQQETLDAAAK